MCQPFGTNVTAVCRLPHAKAITGQIILYLENFNKATKCRQNRGPGLGGPVMPSRVGGDERLCSEVRGPLLVVVVLLLSWRRVAFASTVDPVTCVVCVCVASGAAVAARHVTLLLSFCLLSTTALVNRRRSRPWSQLHGAFAVRCLVAQAESAPLSLSLSLSHNTNSRQPCLSLIQLVPRRWRVKPTQTPILRPPSRGGASSRRRLPSDPPPRTRVALACGVRACKTASTSN
jgi:hypothetical protein